MNTPIDPQAQENRPLINEQRRRLAKGGLAAPIVLGTLLSRPVLGAAPHNCTISGQMSGNVSTHVQGVCSTLGRSPSYYAGITPSLWPNATTDFLNNSNALRSFQNTPFSQSPRFKNAFERYNTANQNIADAKALDVLQGDWDLTNADKVLRVRLTGGFDTAKGIALGKEAVAAYMNAVDGTKGYPNFPISGAQVVAMFNAVIMVGGKYDPTGVNWGIMDVIQYFQSLHA